jgi:hypothetical protein
VAELKLTPGFATIQHQQMAEPLALVLLLKVAHVIHKYALQVKKIILSYSHK